MQENKRKKERKVPLIDFEIKINKERKKEMKEEERTILLTDGRKRIEKFSEADQEWYEYATECTCCDAMTYEHMLDSYGECGRI